MNRAEKRPAIQAPAIQIPKTYPARILAQRPDHVKGTTVDFAHNLAVDLAAILEREVPGIDLAEVGRELANQAFAR